MFIEAPVILFIAWSNVIGTQYLMPVKRVNEFTAVGDGWGNYKCDFQLLFDSSLHVQWGRDSDGNCRIRSDGRPTPMRSDDDSPAGSVPQLSGAISYLAR